VGVEAADRAEEHLPLHTQVRLHLNESAPLVEADCQVVVGTGLERRGLCPAVASVLASSRLIDWWSWPPVPATRRYSSSKIRDALSRAWEEAELFETGQLSDPPGDIAAFASSFRYFQRISATERKVGNFDEFSPCAAT